MKTIRLIVAFLAVVVMAGCATNTGTGAAAGGLLGGGFQKLGGGSVTKGAVGGALVGAGIGVLMDSQEKKDNERAEKTNAILQQRGVGVGSSDMEAVRTDAQTDANLAFAQKERNNCEVEFAKEKKAGMNPVYICKQVFDAAYFEAKGDNFNGSYGGGCIGRYLRANSIRPGHSRIIMWRERARNKCQRGGYSYGYR